MIYNQRMFVTDRTTCTNMQFGTMQKMEVTGHCLRCSTTPNVTKIVSEYDQEIPQSQTADKPMAPRLLQSIII